MTLPSKELIETVFGIDKLTAYDINGTMLNYNYFNGSFVLAYINIYEFTKLIKEWMVSNELIDTVDIVIGSHNTTVELVGECDSGEGGCSLYLGTEPTEVDAIIKSAE